METGAKVRDAPNLTPHIDHKSLFAKPSHVTGFCASSHFDVGKEMKSEERILVCVCGSVCVCLNLNFSSTPDLTQFRFFVLLLNHILQ